MTILLIEGRKSGVTTLRTNDFQRRRSEASDLTPSQREQALASFTEERQLGDVTRAIEAPHPRRCPHCHHTHYIHWGNAHGLPRYRCGACHKTFNLLTGTPLTRLRHQACWPEYAQALIDSTTGR